LAQVIFLSQNLIISLTIQPNNRIFRQYLD
jgi:hypothetical protein